MRPSKIEIRLTNWLTSWLCMICAFVFVITFTVYRPTLDMRFIVFISKRNMKKRIFEKEKIK